MARTFGSSGKQTFNEDVDNSEAISYQSRIVLVKHSVLLVSHRAMLDLHGVGVLLHHCIVDGLSRGSWCNLRLATPCLRSGAGVVRCRGIGVGGVGKQGRVACWCWRRLRRCSSCRARGS